MLITRFIFQKKICFAVLEGKSFVYSTTTFFKKLKNAGIRTYLNVEVVLEDNDGMRVYSVSKIFSFLSSFMTLMPGDLIITCTSGRDTVEVEIDGTGRLSNPVSDAQ